MSSKGLLRLTNDDDWEAYYTWNPDTKEWVLRDENHTCRVQDILALAGVPLQEAVFDFDETGWRAPDTITQEEFDALED